MIATVNGNFLSLGAVETVPRNSEGPFKKLEESADTDRNAGQHTTAPYLAELRRNGMREDEESSKSPRMAKDPFGRIGTLFDSVA